MKANSNAGEKLTPREMEVLHLLVTGMTDKDIAGALKLSVRTVRHHLSSSFRKRKVSRRSELIVSELGGREFGCKESR